MNEQEEAAFVDSFFLPDGILEEDEEEVNEQPSSSLWSGAPPENPWANEVPLQTSWNSAAATRGAIVARNVDARN